MISLSCRSEQGCKLGGTQATRHQTGLPRSSTPRMACSSPGTSCLERLIPHTKLPSSSLCARASSTDLGITCWCSAAQTALEPPGALVDGGLVARRYLPAGSATLSTHSPGCASQAPSAPQPGRIRRFTGISDRFPFGLCQCAGRSADSKEQQMTSGTRLPPHPQQIHGPKPVDSKPRPAINFRRGDELHDHRFTARDGRGSDLLDTGWSTT